MNLFSASTISSTGFAALFIDFENIFYFLKRKFHNPPELEDYAFEILRNLRLRLESEYSLQTIIMKAYADFERLGTPAQGSLYLMGIDTHNVLGTEHKNAADMRLCIDAMEVLYMRPEIHTFIFVAGDRDYIPVIQHLKRQGRHVLVSAFRENVSGDLLQNIGKPHFIDALELLSAEKLTKLEKREAEDTDQKRKAEVLKSKGLPVFKREFGTIPEPALLEEDATTRQNIVTESPKIVSRPPSFPPKPISTNIHYAQAEEPERSEFENISLLEKEEEIKCLEFIMENMGRRSELWMGPFLRRLNEHLPLLADYERKMLLERLTQAGVIRIEKRRGEPYDFTVLLLNYNHPDVRKLNRG